RRRARQSPPRHLPFRLPRRRSAPLFLTLALCCLATPFSFPFLILFRLPYFSLLPRHPLRRLRLQRPPRRAKRPSSLRRLHPSQLPSNLHPQQLAQSRSAASLANISLRRPLRHALSRLRRSHGYRA